MSLDSIDDYFDKVEAWRCKRLLELWDDMDVDQAGELARNHDREMLHKAERLHADGCPAALAYRILR